MAHFLSRNQTNSCPKKNFVQLFRIYFHIRFCFNRCFARFYLRTGAVAVAWFNPSPFTCVFPVYVVHASLYVTYKNLSRVLGSAGKLYKNKNGGVLVWARKKNMPNPRPKKSVRMNLPIALPLGLHGDEEPRRLAS